MHIIGIKIEEGCELEVLKNLKPGWYPFGNYDEPVKENSYKWRKGSEQSDRLYQLYPNMPQISISCVIGKNGSGKTTLFDILFRILNNFGYSVYKKTEEYGSTDYRSVESVDGLHAKLYFEIDSKVGYIDVDEHKITLYHSINADDNYQIINDDDYYGVLSELFYTIGVNYSIHSMRFRDFDGRHEGYNQWMCNVYDNEADYRVPLSFSPYRVDGEIDIKREEYLAERRLMTLSILLYSQRKQLIANYTPLKITYKIGDHNDDLNKLSIRRGVPDSYNEIIKHFAAKWKSLFDTFRVNYSKELWETIINSLAYETTRICLTFKSYGKILGLDDIRNAEKDGKTPEIEKAVNAANYDRVIERLRNHNNDTSIALDIKQILYYIKENKIKGESGCIEIDKILNKKAFESYNDIYKLLPPLFFNVDLYYIKSGDSTSEIKLSEMSSGEKQMLFSNSAILYHIHRIANVKDETNIIAYKHINIVLDEVELYSHPEFQRRYIAAFVDMLAGLHIDNTKIHSINMIIATHSPFLLSDVPKENVICLKDGKPYKEENESYCANIYDLLNKSFFLDYPMGEAARRTIDTIILDYNQHRENSKHLCNVEKDKHFYKYLKGIIGEPYLKETISIMLSSILKADVIDRDSLMERKQLLEKELKEINNKLEQENE